MSLNFSLKAYIFSRYGEDMVSCLWFYNMSQVTSLFLCLSFQALKRHNTIIHYGLSSFHETNASCHCDSPSNLVDYCCAFQKTCFWFGVIPLDLKYLLASQRPRGTRICTIIFDMLPFPCHNYLSPYTEVTTWYQLPQKALSARL